MPKHYYVIKKILNNNVVISQDEEKREIIIMGSGIGFGKHIRDVVDPKKILKVYELRNHAFENRFKELVAEIPFECLELTEKIIACSEARLQQKLKDGLVLALADHIYFAVQQTREGKSRTLLMNAEIRRLYREEYDAALEAVDMINDFYHLELPAHEAAPIAFHLINAEVDNNADDTSIILNGTNEILKIIEDSMGIRLDERTQGYSRLVIHLKYFMKRVIIERAESQDEIISALFNEKDEQYRKIKMCLVNINAYLKETYDYELNEAERLYLMIHIIRVL